MIKYLLLTIINLSEVVIGHSWLDCTDRREDGSCAGYIRNFQGHGDQAESYKILDHNPNTPLCEPKFQSEPIYPDQFPMAKILSGKRAYFDYFENGHITIDRFPPDHRPHSRHYTVYWKGVPMSEPDSRMRLRGDINHAIALETKPFDDGECSDVNSPGRLGPTPCIGGYTIPAGTRPGKYQLAWVWHFDRDPRGTGEEYTSCFDVEVISPQEYSAHQNKQFPPFNPYNFAAIGNNARSIDMPRDSTLSRPVNCNDPKTFDSSRYNCFSDGYALCPKSQKVCGKGQCYDPKTYQCCSGYFLLLNDQACNIVANPFRRLARLKRSGA